nr:proprotein convertase P-domain-containing protein [Kofleriaceae bacterium]
AVRKIIVAIGQLNHAATSHLDIKLVSPAGAGRFVATDIPTTGTAANYTSTILNDSAAAAISSVTAANAPFRGAYRPASSLTVTAGIDFLNVPAIGNWALAIADDTAGTSGTLQRWTLAMCIDENSICGNGIVDAGEACDDGNTNFGDGCNASCRIETGYACGGAPSTCNVVCGDSLLVGPERCDDGNQINNDGCSATCNLELTCTGGATPVIFTSTDVAKAIPDLSAVSSVVTVGTLGTVRKAIVAVGSLVHPAVGDLTIDLINPAGQARRLMQTPFLFTPAANLRSTIFNDSAATALASANFTQAPFVGSWKPSATLSTSAAVDFLGQAAPGTWSLRIGDSFLSQSGTLEAWSLGLCIDQNAICGDGIVVAGETCDDGNTVNGDGCTSTCGTEGGYTCVGAPSVCTFGCGAGETLVTVSNTTATTVPDGDSIGLLSPLTVTTAGLVRSVTPALSISHGQVSQLTVSLLSPFGGERQLASGGTGANYSATSFNDGAPRSITGGLAPFSGQFRPLQTISGNPPNGHSNQSAAGIWQLRVRDNSAGTVGTLNSWSLRVCVDTSTPKLCGNGIVEAGESCDDGNAGNGDGCSSTCGIELTCGVGETRVVQRASGMPFNVTPAVSQSPLAIATAGVVSKALVVFDAVASSNGALSSTLIAPSGQRAPLTSFGDSNFAGTMFDDSAATNFTSGATPHTGRWKPATALSTLAGVTANGTWKLEASNYNGALVRGWTLAVCVDAVGRCGDGQLQFGETCDDGNVANGDGCNDACRIDGGYTCVGLPSVCTFACGPGETLVTAANTTALSIPTGDNRGVLSSITLPTTGLIRSVTPTVNVTHGNVAELSLSLLPPYGTARALSKGSGTGANLVNVSFHDASSRLIANASAPIAGQFRPVETLASDGAKDFKGQASGGKWHLRLSTGNTAGLLTGWSLKVCVDTSVPRVCGNGIVEATETCDDGNSTNGDGCASSCQLEFSCGAGETPVLTRSTGGPVLFSDTLASSPVTVAATGTVRKAVVIVDALSADISYDVSLASPANQLAGRLVPVSSRLISTYLDDAAPTRIDFGSSPYRGRFRPFNGSLAPMIGQSAAGVWSLQVRDSGSIPGVLHAWSLGLCVQ